MLIDLGEMRKLAEIIRMFYRAMKGQTLDEDLFAGLINIKDLRERTRLSEHDVYGHSGMHLIAKWYPEEMGHWKEIADLEDIYFISLEGEQRKEAILMQRAKTAITQPLALQMPQVETKPIEPEAKKKGILRR